MALGELQRKLVPFLRQLHTPLAQDLEMMKRRIWKKSEDLQVWLQLRTNQMSQQVNSKMQVSLTPISLHQLLGHNSC